MTPLFGGPLNVASIYVRLHSVKSYLLQAVNSLRGSMRYFTIVPLDPIKKRPEPKFQEGDQT